MKARIRVNQRISVTYSSFCSLFRSLSLSLSHTHTHTHKNILYLQMVLSNFSSYFSIGNSHCSLVRTDSISSIHRLTIVCSYIYILYIYICVCVCVCVCVCILRGRETETECLVPLLNALSTVVSYLMTKPSFRRTDGALLNP